MQTKSDTLEKQLKEVCSNFINLVEKIKSQGLISEEEYTNYIEFKKFFLQNTDRNINNKG